MTTKLWWMDETSTIHKRIKFFRKYKQDDIIYIIRDGYCLPCQIVRMDFFNMKLTVLPKVTTGVKQFTITI